MLISNITIPRYNGLFIFTFAFFISIANKFSENCFFVWEFGSETKLILLFFVVTNLISLWVLIFSIVFPNTELFINLKKSFSNSFFASFLNLVFISIYDFNHAFCWDLITLCTVFNFAPLINACFKALMCMTYFSLSSILQPSFSTFSNFFLWGKIGGSLWDSHNVLDTLYLLQENILHHFFHHNYLLNSSLKSDK